MNKSPIFFSLPFVLAGFLNLLFNYGYAQNEANTASIVKVYNNNSGLKYQSINQIVLDNNGFLWMGTNTGIVRFDGKNFVDFPLKDKRRFGEFYHNKSEGNIVIRDSKDWFYRLENGRILTDSLISIQKKHYFYSSRNELILLTKNEYENVELLRKELDTRWGGNDYFITKNNDLYLHRPGSTKLFYISEGKNIVKSLPASTVGMQFILNDTLYFLSENGEFNRMYKGNILQKEGFNGAAIKDFLNDYIKLMPYGFNQYNEFIYSNNERAIFYYKNTIWRLKHTDKGFVMIPERQGLPTIKDVSGIEYRKEDNSYFISSSSEGLFVIRPKSFTVLHSKLGIQNENNCMALMPVGKDSILSARGVYYFSGKTLKTDLLLDPYTLGMDNAGQLYYAASINRNNFHRFYYSGSLMQNPVSFEDTILTWNTCIKTNPGSGQVYLSDYQFIYKKNANKLEKVIHLAVDDNHIIHCFDFYDDSKIVIGTSNQILVYNEKTQTTDSILRGVLARSIYIDRKSGYIWIGTYGKGYLIFKPGGQVFRLPLDRDRNLEYVHNFMPDERGYMWSGTNNGLYRYKISQVYNHIKDSTVPIHYMRFDNSDGLTSNELNGGAQPSVVRDNAGTVFISSIDGLIRFQPESIPVPDNKQKIFLQSVLADDRELNPDSVIAIPHINSRIKFILANSALGNEKNDFVEYNLPTLSNKWLPVDQNNEITFNGLPYGHYKIIVRKETNEGYVFSEFPFEVLPAFYQTWWFYTISILLLALLLWFAYSQRVKWLTKKKEELEETVRLKTISLNESVSALTTANHDLSESYRTIEKVTGIVLHDLRSPLKFLSVITRRLEKNHDKVDKKELAEDLNLLHTTSVNTFLFTNDLLGWLMNNNKDLKNAKSLVNVYEPLKEISDVYQPLIEINQNTFHSQIERDLPAVTNAHLVGIIIRNALDNANKYTSNGIIELSAKIVNDKISIKIIDNGRGFDIAVLKRKLTDKDDSLKATLGIKIIDDLAKKIGATYDFESTIGVGTVFSLELDMNQII